MTRRGGRIGEAVDVSNAGFFSARRLGKLSLTNLETGNVTDLPPFEVVVKDGLKARPKQHVDSVKEAVQYRNPSSLHNHRVRMRDLDH